MEIKTIHIEFGTLQTHKKMNQIAQINEFSSLVSKPESRSFHLLI